MSQKKLIKLVSGLSKAEVRNFNWFAKRQKGNHKYKLLFDQIRQGVHEDDKLALSIEVPTEKLKVYKSQLKKLVLESLLFLRLRRDEVVSLVEIGELENQKGLTKDSIRHMGQARKISKEKESFGYWMLLNDKIKKSGLEGDQYLQEWEANRKTIEYLQLRNIRFQLRKGVEELQTPGPKISLIDSIVAGNPILSQPESIGTVRGKAEYFKIKRIIHIYRGELVLAKEFAARYVEVWESHPAIFKKEEAEYIQELRVLSTLHLNDQDFLNAFVQLEKLETFKTESPKISALKKYFSILPRLNLSIDYGMGEIGIHAARTVISNVEFFRLFLETYQFQSLLYRTAYYLVLAGNYAPAQKLLHELINRTSRKGQQRFWEYSRLLLLLIHFETEDVLSFEFLLEQVYNYYRNNPSKLEFFSLACKLYKKLYLHSEDPRSVFESFGPQFEAIKGDRAEKFALDNCDLSSWIGAKIRNTTWLNYQKELASFDSKRFNSLKSAIGN